MRASESRQFSDGSRIDAETGRAVVIDSRMLDFADRAVRLEDGLVVRSDVAEMPSVLLAAQMPLGAGLSLA